MKKILFISLLLFFAGNIHAQEKEKAEKALFRAVINSEVYTAKLLLEKGLTANIKDENGNTLLYRAVSNTRYLPLFELLLKHGADPNVVSSNGESPLHTISNRYWAGEDIAELFLKNGANVNALDRDGNTPAHLCGSSRTKLAMLYTYNKADLTIKNKNGETPYELTKRKGYKSIMSIYRDKVYTPYFLAQFGTFKHFKRAVKNNLKDINKPSKYGYSLIYYTCSRLSEAHRFTEYLINTGADINTSYLEALDVSLERKNVKLINLLRTKSKDKFLNLSMPLNIAIETGDLNIVKLLVESGAHVDSMNIYGVSAIHSACGWNYYEKQILINKDIISYLLEQGADINQKDVNGITPLEQAISKNASSELLNFLISKGANTHIKPEGDWTWLHLAVQHRSINSLDALVHLTEDVNVTNNLEQNAISYAVSSYNPDHEIIKKLIKLGVSTTQIDTYGESPMYKTIKNRDFDLVELLSKSHTDYNVVTKKGKSLIHAYVDSYRSKSKKEIEVLKFLVDKGADINIQDKDGKTALLSSLSNKVSAEQCKLLISKTTVNQKDNQHNTPLIVATENMQDIKILTLLVDAGADINCVNKQNHNLAEISLKKNNYDALDFYLSKGIKLSPLGQSPKSGEILIKLAQVENPFKSLEPVLANTSDISNIIYENETALHFAALNPKGFEAVKLLVEKGADIFATMPYVDDNPLHYAVKGGNANTINYLRNLQNTEISKYKEQTKKLNSMLIVENIVPIDTSHFQELVYAIDLKQRSKYYCSNYNSSGIDLPHLIAENAFLNKVPMYSSNYNPYMPLHIKRKRISSKTAEKRLGGGEQEIYMYDDETGEPEPSTIVEDIDKNDITGLIFWDEWTFDEHNCTIDKTVRAYSPVSTYIDFMESETEDKLTKTAFTFVFEDYKNKRARKKAEKKMVLFKKVKYETFLGNETYSFNKKDDFSEEYFVEKQNSPNWTSLTQERFVNMLVNNVLSGNKKAYDFNTGKKLNQTEIRKQLGERFYDVYDFDPDTFEEILIKVKEEHNNDDIKSVIFHENWYIDTETLRIKKEVVAVTPIRWHFSEDDVEQTNQLKTYTYTIKLTSEIGNTSNANVEITTPLNNKLQDDNSQTHYSKDFIFENEDKNSIDFEKAFTAKFNNKAFPLYELDDFGTTSAYSTQNYLPLNTKDREKKYKDAEMMGLKCYEKWNFNEKNFTFTKDIYAYSPFIKYIAEEGSENDYYSHFKLLGYILQPNTQDKAKMKLFRTVTYEVGQTLYNSELTKPHIEDFNPIFWNATNTKKFTEIILEKAYSGKSDFYDYKTGDKLTAEKLKENCFLYKDSYETEDDFGDYIFVENPVYLESIDIKSLIFKENWYINPETLEIKKEVISITPVGYFQESSDAKIKRILPFTMKF